MAGIPGWEEKEEGAPVKRSKLSRQRHSPETGPRWRSHTGSHPIWMCCPREVWALSSWPAGASPLPQPVQTAAMLPRRPPSCISTSRKSSPQIGGANRCEVSLLIKSLLTSSPALTGSEGGAGPTCWGGQMGGRGAEGGVRGQLDVKPWKKCCKRAGKLVHLTH